MQYVHEYKEKKTQYVGPRPGFPEPDVGLLGRMLRYLSSRELSFTTARVNGWYPSAYMYAPRIVIPCSNTAGVPYFQARDMSGKAKLRYASPAASRDDSIVLVWPQDKAKGTVIIEGPMCALAAAECGYLGIAIMGNQPTDEVLEHVASFARSFQPVMVLPDIDMFEFGSVMIGALSQRGIIGEIVLLNRKDLADMSAGERKRFLP